MPLDQLFSHIPPLPFHLQPRRNPFLSDLHHFALLLVCLLNTREDLLPQGHVEQRDDVRDHSHLPELIQQSSGSMCTYDRHSLHYSLQQIHPPKVVLLLHQPEGLTVKQLRHDVERVHLKPMP